MLNYKELQQLLQPIQHNNPQYPQSNQIQTNQASPQTQQIQTYALNLSHRQLRKVPPLIPFKQYPIQQLTLAFNFLKDLKSLRQLSSPHLSYFNLSFNFLTSIQKIGSSFSSLKILDANANRIVSVELNDTQFPVLQALYLKNNKIQYFVHCPNSVEILCLDRNQLGKLAFTGGQNLQILSASYNKIEELELENVENLNFLDLQENKVSDLQRMKKMLGGAQNLLSLNMINNYISKIAHKKYLIEMLVTCPKLVKVDQIIINPHVRQAFKIMAEEDKMGDKMKQTEEKYRYRMQQQLKLKEEMIEKLRQEQAGIQRKFQEFIKKQKEQLDVLQNYAKNNMGKKIMGVVDENKPFNNLANQYNKKKPLQPLSQDNASQLKQNSTQNKHPLDYLPQKQAPSSSPQQIGNQLTKFLVQGIIISKHKDEYNEYKRNRTQEHATKTSKQSKIKKYLGLEDGKNNAPGQVNNKGGDQPGDQEDSDGFNNSMSDGDDQLSVAEKDRRKKNMRNPGLVYRNSNQLIGAPPINIDEDLSSDEDFAFNKKCLPYLIKNYGFHTVI